jgi:UDP-glucose 4-epimerase
MRILVAGGAGYIGSVTSWLLLEHGHDVVVYDNLDRGHKAAVPKGATFIHADLGDEKTLQKAFKTHKIEAVMHFAAHSQVGESMEKPEIYFENNVTVGQRMLDSMVAAGVPFIVFSSTCAIFGEPEVFPMHENLPKIPTNVYGETKLIFEKMLHWYHKIHGLNYTALRYFNACGAHAGMGEDHTPETHLIPVVLDVALGKREKIFVFGDDYPTPDGTCIRDYIHIYDLAMAHLLALEKCSTGANAFNLGNGGGYSVKEVIDTARQVSGRPIPEEIAPRRPGDPPKLVGSAEKALAELGWAPHYPQIEAIIESAWKWHKANPNGYKR